MRDGIIVEVEGRKDGVAGIDPYVFEAQEQEDRPKQVDELRGQEKRAERDLRRYLFSTQCSDVVSYEHRLALSFVESSCLTWNARSVNFARERHREGRGFRGTLSTQLDIYRLLP